MSRYEVKTCPCCGKIIKGKLQYNFEVKDLNPIPDYAKQERLLDEWREYQNKGE